MNPIGIVLRRIIYTIPLKLLLILLAIFGVLFACFSSADNVFSLLETYTIPNISIQNNVYSTIISFSDYISEEKTICFIAELNGFDTYGINIGISDYQNTTPYNSFNYKSTNNYLCYVGSPGLYINAKGRSSNGTVNFKFFFLNDLLNTGLPILSSLECQTQYNLIPISSVDQNYCTTNNLCPTYDCPTNPIGSGTLSNLYINNILHIGAPNIVMNIPEEIDWDYAYTQGGNTMNIDVVGYNQDFEKIEGWIETNNYKPTSDDFTNIFKNFSNFGGLLIGALFVILVFYFVKKLFK